MSALPHFSPVNDDGLCATVLEQIDRVARAQKDADKANVFCASDDYERCWTAVKTEKVELRRLLINAGIDWITFERSYQS